MDDVADAGVELKAEYALAMVYSMGTGSRSLALGYWGGKTSRQEESRRNSDIV